MEYGSVCLTCAAYPCSEHSWLKAKNKVTFSFSNVVHCCKCGISFVMFIAKTRFSDCFFVPDNDILDQYNVFGPKASFSRSLAKIKTILCDFAKIYLLMCLCNRSANNRRTERRIKCKMSSHKV